MKNEISTNYIKSKIYVIRGKEVMLDRDLASFYKVETKVLIQSVKRNIKRFPSEFMFQLDEKEFSDWRSHFVTSKNDKKGLRRAPYAFTEQGVAMISGLLKSDIAIETSIKIINAFVTMRHILLDIFNKAKKELIIIDNYVDKKLLDLICNLSTDVVVVSSNMNEQLIKKYQSQYNNLTIKYSDSFHDRFIIIDNINAYHLGSSLKDLGKKCSYISKIEKDEDINEILDSINLNKYEGGR